jgi:hypothetical protein
VYVRTHGETKKLQNSNADCWSLAGRLYDRRFSNLKKQEMFLNPSSLKRKRRVLYSTKYRKFYKLESLGVNLDLKNENSVSVTRWVCEKIVQNVNTPTHVLPKRIHSLHRGKKSPKSFWQFVRFSKLLATVNNHPIGENSPNLVTLNSVNMFEQWMQLSEESLAVEVGERKFPVWNKCE